ncbi:MAG: hypothetical protein ACREO8_03210 [Luteimonas sp.]
MIHLPASKRAGYRRCFKSLVMWALSAAWCMTATAEPRVGVHGMVLFGGHDGLYGYHLAMFHAPHDRQVLVRLRATDPVLDRQLRKALAARPSLWTLAPQSFDLDRLAPGAALPLREFTADVVSGHFERGGDTAHTRVTLRVEKVLMFRPLAPTLGPPQTLRYDVVGEGEERFLVKRIERRPDFDQIVAFRTRSRDDAAMLSVVAQALRPATTKQLASALQAQSGLQPTRWTSVYHDAADLQ